jgi:hypothetical protein
MRNREVERHIAVRLSEFGYGVELIELAPFNLLATYGSCSILVDTKFRKQGRRYYIINQSEVEGYLNFNTIVAQMKVVIFTTPKLPDCFINVEHIPKLCFTVGPLYWIERHITTNLAYLRKLIEVE